MHSKNRFKFAPKVFLVMMSSRSFITASACEGCVKMEVPLTAFVSYDANYVKNLMDSIYGGVFAQLRSVHSLKPSHKCSQAQFYFTFM